MKTSVGIIGVGAFGRLAVQHLAPHFNLVLYDPNKDLTPITRKYGGHVGDLIEAASCEVILLAIPVQRLHQVLTEISSIIKRDAIIIDVASVKIKPIQLMLDILPQTTQIVSTHPLFGPQTGKSGIAGLNIVICPVRGIAAGAVIRRFCKKQLGLHVLQTTPEDHDREMAYVQGLTHLISKIVVELGLPPFRCTTKTFCLMQQMVESVRYDSDELFRAIELENPYAREAKRSFFAAVRKVEDKLTDR